MRDEHILTCQVFAEPPCRGPDGAACRGQVLVDFYIDIAHCPKLSALVPYMPPGLRHQGRAHQCALLRCTDGALRICRRDAGFAGL